MDQVEVEEKHIPKPGVHRGNYNSLDYNDHKLLNMAEWWQDFLKELAEHWRVCVMILTAQRDDYLIY